MYRMNNGSIICNPAATSAKANTPAAAIRCGHSHRRYSRRYSRRWPRRAPAPASGGVPSPFAFPASAPPASPEPGFPSAGSSSRRSR
jgi:hypothetical protein